MRSSRFLAALTAAMLFVLYAGCGEEKKDSGSTGSGRVTQGKNSAKAGSNTDDRPAGQTASASGGHATSAEKGSIDASLATPDNVAAIVVNPRRLAASPLVAEQLKKDMVAQAIKKFGIDPSEVEQIVVLVSMGELRPGNPEPFPVITFRFTHDVDAKEVLTKAAAAMAGPNGPQPIKEVRTGDKTCFDLGPGDTALVCALSKNTLVLTRKGPKVATEFMEKALAVTEPKGSLYERLKKANADNDLIAVVEMEKIPDLEKQIDAAKKDAPQMLHNYLEGAKTLRCVTLGLDLAGDPLLQIVLESKDAAGAETVEDLLKDGKKALDGGLAALRQSASKETKAEFADAFKLGDKAIAGISVTKSGSQVTAVLKRPADLDKVGALVEKVLDMMSKMYAAPMPMPRDTKRAPPGQSLPEKSK